MLSRDWSELARKSTPPPVTHSRPSQHGPCTGVQSTMAANLHLSSHVNCRWCRRGLHRYNVFIVIIISDLFYLIFMCRTSLESQSQGGGRKGGEKVKKGRSGERRGRCSLSPSPDAQTVPEDVYRATAWVAESNVHADVSFDLIVKICKYVRFY